MVAVSVILTTYNKPLWLAKCIESVNRQSFEDWELIIMDDNSSDKGVAPILDLYEDHPKIQIHRETTNPRERKATARYATLINKAVTEFSSGTYITYLADDDFYYPYRLERMVDRLEEDEEISVVYGAQHFVDVDDNVSGFRKTLGVLDSAWDKVDHNSVMHTRESFDVVGGWDDDVGTWGGADSHFWRRLTDAGFKFYPLHDDVPNECKRYHTGSIQWRMSNNLKPY